jgi:hypothetical protein
LFLILILNCFTKIFIVSEMKKKGWGVRGVTRT